MKRKGTLLLLFLVITLALGGILRPGSFAGDGDRPPQNLLENIRVTVEVADRIYGSSTLDTYSVSIQGLDGAPLPSELVKTASFDSSNQGPQEIVFGPINFSEELLGDEDEVTLSYELVQSSVDPLRGTPIPGMNYDSQPLRTVKVVLSLDGDTGLLQASVTSGLSYRNNFYPEPLDRQIRGTKVFQGGNLTDGLFTFDLYEADKDYEIVEGGLHMVTTNVGNEWIFDLKYDIHDLGKHFYYVVKERLGSLTGVTYSQHVYKIERDVFYSTSSEDLSSISISNYNNFTNHYVAISGRKEVRGLTLADDDNSFTFELHELTSEGEPTGAPLRTTTNVGDSWSFPMEFNGLDVGEHWFYYMVKERNDGLPGYLYDDRVFYYDIRVSVTTPNNNVITNISFVREPEDPVFINRYATTSYSPLVLKLLEGKDLQAEDFEFEIFDQDGLVVRSAKNSASGLVEFSPLSFSGLKVGDKLTYRVREVPGTDPNMDYDNSVYEFILQIADLGEGQLGAVALDDYEIAFFNTYNPPVDNTNGDPSGDPNGDPADESNGDPSDDPGDQSEDKDEDKSEAKQDDKTKDKLPATGQKFNPFIMLLILALGLTGIRFIRESR